MNASLSLAGRLLVLGVAMMLLAACGGNLLSAGVPGFRPLLYHAQLSPTTISPNADGRDDVASIRYEIGRTATVSIYFTDGAGQRHYFRQQQRRSPGSYNVYWGGVINDQQVRVVPGGQELVESQVLPDGVYTWAIEATDDAGQTSQAAGQVTIEAGDTALPELHNFSVVPSDFTPNQDSIHDRVSISYFLTKKAEVVRVYVEKPRTSQRDPSGPTLRYPITEDPADSSVEPGAAGYHGYEYDGGVDLNAEPPPDGDYIVSACAEDKVGNRTSVSTTLTIREGGKPRAEVAGGEIRWQDEMNRTVGVPLGRKLCFTATVVNIGPVPIRTSGPWPGQLYKFTENHNTLAANQREDSWYMPHGAWRFGITFDTTGVDFPYRWAIGRPEDLEKRIIDGQPEYYLLPGHRGQVYGCIQFDAKPPVGTQFWWGGLIHEAVAVTNDQINRIEVKVGAP